MKASRDLRMGGGGVQGAVFDIVRFHDEDQAVNSLFHRLKLLGREI